MFTSSSCIDVNSRFLSGVDGEALSDSSSFSGNFLFEIELIFQALFDFEFLADTW